MERILGLGPSQLVGAMVADLVAPPHGPLVLAQLARANGSAVELEWLNGKFFIRFGVSAKNVSGTNYEWGDVDFQVGTSGT